MGYQLYMLMLCADVLAVVTPNHGLVLFVSGCTSGGRGFFHAVQTPCEVAVQLGAIPVELIEPSPERSAGSCSSKIAFGFTGLETPPAGDPAPFAVGATTPLAKPRLNHSLV